MNVKHKLATKLEMLKRSRGQGAGAMNIGGLIAFAVGIVYLASISGVGAIVLDALNTSTTNSDAQDIIGYGITSISNLGAQLGTIGTVIGVVFLLSIVMGALGGTLMGQGGGPRGL